MIVGATTFGADGGRSGIGRYVTQLFRAMAEEAGGPEWRVAAHPAELGVFMPDSPRWRACPVSPFWGAPLKNIVWHQMALGQFCRNEKVDALFLPAGNRRLPLRVPCPSIGVVHDFSALHVAAKYDPARMFYIRKVLPALIRRLSHVITVSESSRRDLLDFAGVPPERITVTPLGADHSLFNPGDPDLAKSAVAGALGVRGPYFLYVSRLEHPGKNHVRLIQAFDRFKKRAGLPHKLVLAGSDWSGAEAVHAAAAAASSSGDILFPGFTPGGLLPDLYRAAAGVVFPSLFEGFGLPVLEAMCCGTPVACSNVSSMPEVAGDASILFDPESIEDIAAAMERLSTDVELRRRLAAGGPARAAEFTWQRTARLTLAAIQQTVARGKD